MARNYKKNTVKVDLASFVHYWRGLRKVGKTTLFRDLLLEKYGTTDAGLLISVGNEDGYQALDGLIFDVADDWSTFSEIIDDLVENKNENEFKLIAWDTVDEVIKIAIEEVMRLHKRKKGEVAESLNAALGGYGAGRQKVIELVDEQMTKLKRAGYGLIFIGHTKLKDVKEKIGNEYQQLTSSLNADYDGIFANKADIIMTISVDKDITDKVITGTQRYMHFRDDGFIDCGTRLKEMPSKVEFSAKNYLDAFEQGVKSSMNNPISDADFKKKEKAEQKQKEEDYKKLKETLSQPKNEDLVVTIQNKYPKANDDVKEKVKAVMSEYNISNFKEPESLSNEGLQKIVEILG